ncbi:MAG: PP2C family protein-serine/threonine phosphatase, partial [Acidobacteriaceae bacterium]
AGLEDAAQVYWNGRLVGSYGRIPPRPVWYEGAFGGSSLPFAFDLGSAGTQPRTAVLAIRVWVAPYVFFSGENVGGLTAVPEIGSAKAIRDQLGREKAVWLESSLYELGLALVEGLVALLALLAWLRDRRQWMLFWLAIYTTHAVLLVPFNVPGLMSFRASYGLIAPVVCVEDVSLWFLLLYLLRLRDDPRLVRWTLWMTAVALLGNFGDGALQLFPWTTWPAHLFLRLDIGLTLPSLLVETWVLVLVAFALRRRLDAARWLLAIAATLVDVVQAVGDWGNAGSRWTHWNAAGLVTTPLFTVAGNAFTLTTLADTLLLAAVVYAVWGYETEQREEQTRLNEEFRNAQELQQVLVPESLPEVPGYTVTSAYRPAQEVGGDFFQVIPLAGHGALAIVGDVSGKGLKAAMTVSLIVGALRSLVETTSDPAEILAGLNRRLLGRLKDGFATCVAVRLEADGACAMANAGHLAPFLNGQELELPGTLPLGLSPEAEYEEITVRLEAGDRLTLYTDGLPEARNAAGELFGFARVAELVLAHPNAGDIAEAAVRFGQDDDVTVLTLCHRGGGAARGVDGMAAAAEGAAV